MTEKTYFRCLTIHEVFYRVTNVYNITVADNKRKQPLFRMIRFMANIVTCQQMQDPSQYAHHHHSTLNSAAFAASNPSTCASVAS